MNHCNNHYYNHWQVAIVSYNHATFIIPTKFNSTLGQPIEIEMSL